MPTDVGRPLLHVLRPALLGAAWSGSLPLSVQDGRWRLQSPATKLTILLNVLLLGLLATSYTRGPPDWSHIDSAFDVYFIWLSLDQVVRCVGAVLWSWRNAGKLDALFTAIEDYERTFGKEPMLATAKYVRWFVAYQVIAFFFFDTITVLKGLHAGDPAWFIAVQVMSANGSYGCFVFWVVIFNGICWGLAEMLRGVTERIRKTAENDNVTLLRNLVHQHSRISELCDLVCHTFGGAVALSMYMLILEASLSLYFGLRPTDAVSEDIARTLNRLLSPSTLVLLKLMTNAGHDCQIESCRAAELLQRHLRSQVCIHPTPEAAQRKAELADLHRQLEGQGVQMNMAGYFTLDKQFFVQIIKDFVTLIIAAAQFDMPFLLNK